MAESKAKSEASSSQKTTAKKTTKDKKGVIISICAVVVAVIIIIVVAVLLNNRGLDDSYFVSDASKKVVTIDMGDDESDGESDESDQYMPEKVHFVYTYSGDEVTGAKTYSEFENADKAKAAFEYIKDNTEDEEEANSYELNGKYVIFTSSEESYKNIKPSDIDKQIELIESSRNGGTEIDENDDAVEEDAD